MPGAVGAFIVEVGGSQVQLGGLAGSLQGCAADQHGQHRVLLLRHGRGPAPTRGAWFGELGDLRAAQEQHVGRDLARRVGDGGQGIAEGRDGEAVGVPRGRHGGEAEFCGQPVGQIKGAEARARRQNGAGRQCPGRPSGLHGELERLKAARGGGEAVEPLGRLEPEAERQGVLGEAAAHAEGVRVPFREGGQRRRRCLQLGEQSADGVPGQEDQG